MVVDIKKYNPGFLTDDDIVASFCVRSGELESLLEALRGNTGNSTVHSLVIGPRGSGKTHLLLRAAAEIRRDPSLAGLFPIVFAEESYEVSTTGEFWLECLGRLVDQGPEDEREALRLSYNDLRSEDRDRDLAARCLGTVLDLAERQDKRLVLIVENLNTLFSDMVDAEAGWRLRHTLQNEARIILVGSATSRFEEIDSPDHALYDLFRVITLRPLDTEECAVLWQTISGQPADKRGIRPLEILTGGNPRLLAIIARFGAGRSLRELMDNLLDLVDDHTEYFRSHLESLPPQERRVYLALAKLWKPATSREVADQARLDTNLCSAVLRRLVGRGVVAEEGGTARRRQYHLAERMYNIYYLLRQGAGSNRVVEALIDFMTCFYSPDSIWDLVVRNYEEALSSGSAAVDIAEPVAAALIAQAEDLEEKDRAEEAIKIYEQVIHGSGANGVPEVPHLINMALFKQVSPLFRIGRYDEAISTCDQLLSRLGPVGDPTVVHLATYVLNYMGLALVRVERWAEAIQAHDQALARIAGVSLHQFSDLVTGLTPRQGPAWVQKHNPMEATSPLDEIAMQFGVAEDPGLAEAAAIALICKAAVLDRMGEPLTEGEFSLLLLCLAKGEELLPDFIEVLPQFVARVGSGRALELVQASPAAPLLLPVVTALRQELGQATHVAREVDEVARDIRLDLVRQVLGDAQGWLCGRCEEDISEKGEGQLDHIVPLFNGGANEIENLQLLCHRCNVRKSSEDAGGILRGRFPTSSA